MLEEIVSQERKVVLNSVCVECNKVNCARESTSLIQCEFMSAS